MGQENKVHLGIVLRLTIYFILGYGMVWCSGGGICSIISTGVFLGLCAFELIFNHSLEGVRKVSYLVCAMLVCLAALILAYQAHAAQFIR